MHLSKDERFQYLRYRYREGEHKVNNVAQVILLLQQLNKVHDEGFVHSDIRHTNIVSSYDGKHAWLIDFDLAAKEGTPYPATYNSFLEERHPFASPRKPRKKEHDCHSLSVILKRNGVRSKIVENVRTGKDKLSEIAYKLKDKTNTIIFVCSSPFFARESDKKSNALLLTNSFSLFVHVRLSWLKNPSHVCSR